MAEARSKGCGHREGPVQEEEGREALHICTALTSVPPLMMRGRWLRPHCTQIPGRF